MSEMESVLQQYGEFLLKARLVSSKRAPYFVSWVRRFLSSPALVGSLSDRVRMFREGRAVG